jgi:cyclic pyranopterin phosphate synthase
MDVITVIDARGRKIEYLRISVTQNCNLSCLYCSPGGWHKGEKQRVIFTPKDYQSIIGIMVRLGINRVRITGGEPLVRPDICRILSAVSSVPGISDLSMTTNGVRLASMAQKLKDAGLKRLNISLDSLNRERFLKITGADELTSVLKGIEKAVEVGLAPVKTNTVLIKGINDCEIDEFIKLSKNHPIDVRFIELMPIGRFGEENRDKVVNNSQIITAHPELQPCDTEDLSQPARYYKIPGYLGRIGFISPMSHQFCNSCNRIRLTCDGKIKPCLGNNGETDITEYLGSPEKLQEIISRAIFEKPKGHHFKEEFTSVRNMNEIGG